MKLEIEDELMLWPSGRQATGNQRGHLNMTQQNHAHIPALAEQ